MARVRYGARFKDPVRCNVPGCRRLAYWRPLSPHCDRHRWFTYTNGGPVKAPTDRDIARYRQPIAHVLRMHRDDDAVQAAMKLVTRDLLGYRASTGLTLDTFCETKMGLLRDGNINPLDIIQRVVEIYSLRRDGDPACQIDKVFHTLLARKVLLMKRGVLQHDGAVPNARHLSYLGQRIADTLCRFSAAVLLLVDKYRDERRQFDAACSDMVFPRPKVNYVRHGRTHARPKKLKKVYQQAPEEPKP